MIEAELDVLNVALCKALGLRVGTLSIRILSLLRESLERVAQNACLEHAQERIRCLQDGYTHGLNDARKEINAALGRALPPPFVPPDEDPTRRMRAMPRGVRGNDPDLEHTPPVAMDWVTTPSTPPPRKSEGK